MTKSGDEIIKWLDEEHLTQEWLRRKIQKTFGLKPSRGMISRTLRGIYTTSGARNLLTCMAAIKAEYENKEI